MIPHTPKGSQCINCTKSRDNCSRLDFSTMPVIEVVATQKIVACRMYRKLPNAAGKEAK